MLFKSPYFEMVESGPGVYALIGKTEEGGEPANMALVDMGNDVLMVDAGMLPQSAQDAQRAAQDVIGKPIRTLFITHAHPDHVYGTYTLPTETVIISTLDTRRLTLDRAPSALAELPSGIDGRIEDLRDRLKDPQDQVRREAEARLHVLLALKEAVSEMTTRAAEVTFTDKLTLYGANRHVELIAYGNGHCPGDAIAVVPDAGIAIIGDLLFNGHHPLMVDGNADLWYDQIEELEALEVEHYIPGHGPVSNRDDLETQRTYIRTVQALAREVYDAGGSADDAANTMIPEAYAGYFSSARFGGSVKLAYNALSH